MVNTYMYPVTITNDKQVRCRELTNYEYKNILKFSLNQDNENLCKYFEFLVQDICKSQCTLNYIDKILILLSCRIVSIGENITIAGKENIQNTISLSKVSRTIIENYVPETKEIEDKENNIKVEISYPYLISNKDLLYDKIYSISIAGDRVIMNSTSPEMRDKILNFIPVELAKKIMKAIKSDSNYKQIKLFSWTYEQGNEIDFYFSFNSKQNFDFLKACFSEDLKNMYYYEYLCCSKLNIPLSDFLFHMSPVESILQIKTLAQEIKEQNDAQKKANAPAKPMMQPG